MMSLRGKVAIVYGGARGIGEACAVRLLERGAKVKAMESDWVVARDQGPDRFLKAPQWAILFC